VRKVCFLRDVDVEGSEIAHGMVLRYASTSCSFLLFYILTIVQIYIHACMHPTHENPHIASSHQTIFCPSLNSLKTSPATRIASTGKPAIFATFSAWLSRLTPLLNLCT
jgi:hypothetical protein